MTVLPIAHHLEIAEILPVREYTAFAEDLSQRWSQVTS
jgi:muconolactone D-isomerase